MPAAGATVRFGEHSQIAQRISNQWHDRVEKRSDHDSPFGSSGDRFSLAVHNFADAIFRIDMHDAVLAIGPKATWFGGAVLIENPAAIGSLQHRPMLGKHRFSRYNDCFWIWKFEAAAQTNCGDRSNGGRIAVD